VVEIEVINNSDVHCRNCQEEEVWAMGKEKGRDKRYAWLCCTSVADLGVFWNVNAARCSVKLGELTGAHWSSPK